MARSFKTLASRINRNLLEILKAEYFHAHTEPKSSEMERGRPRSEHAVNPCDSAVHPKLRTMGLQQTVQSFLGQLHAIFLPQMQPMTCRICDRYVQGSALVY